MILQATNRFNRLKFGQQNSFQPITTNAQGKLVVPAHVIIPAIEGDGIGPEIMPQAQKVVKAAIRLAYGLTRSIQWLPLAVGKKALAAGKQWVPDDVVETLKQHHVFVKGPVDTDVGGGLPSANVQLRKRLDLYQCVRPVKVLKGVKTPMKEDKTDVVIFRENTEDLYKGIEFEKDSPLAKVLIFTLNHIFPVLNKLFNAIFKTNHHYIGDIREDSGIGIKPISEFGSKRLIRSAIQYAIDHNRPSVTLVGKGNIMKYTEGAFVKWGYEVAKDEFPGKTITADEFWKDYGGDYKKSQAAGKIVLQERITDAEFQDVILNPQNHSVIATMNLNGDYLSDAFAATVGGLGVAPGANVGDEYAMFESTHGSAPDIAGKNIANPTALFLTMALMLDHLGWKEASLLLSKSIETTLANGKMTGDLARKAGVKALKTDEYSQAVIESMEALAKEKPKDTSAA